jgi:hypothetical protein
MRTLLVAGLLTILPGCGIPSENCSLLKRLRSHIPESIGAELSKTFEQFRNPD